MGDIGSGRRGINDLSVNEVLDIVAEFKALVGGMAWGLVVGTTEG